MRRAAFLVLVVAANAVAAFLVLVVAANVLTAQFGTWPGEWVTAGTWAAGLVLLARDVVHDTGGRWLVFACIVAGGALSWWLSEPWLAAASVAAFAVSELADMTVYAPLRSRGWGRAAFLSGVVGSVVDSALFLWLSGFGLSMLPWQVAAKVGVTALVVGGVVMIRALHGDRVRARAA